SASGSGGSAGVFIDGPNAAVTSVDGDIEIGGTGGAGSNGDPGGSFNVGVRLHQALVSTTGTGNIGLTGNGGGHDDESSASNNNFGVMALASAVQSDEGDITITGFGGDNGADSYHNHGVILVAAS